MKWPKNERKKKKTYTVVALGGGGGAVSAKKGVMLAAVEVDGAPKRPQSGVFKVDWTETLS